MLLDREEHLEARLARGRHPGRHGDLLTKEIVAQSFEEARKPVTLSAKQFDYLGFASWRFFRSDDLAEHAGKIKAFERGAFLSSMDPLGHAGGHGNMDEQFGNRTRFRRGPIAELTFGN